MEKFEALLMPEEQGPSEVLDCKRCELAKQRSRVVWGEGNPNAPIFLLLDNPGAREDREGRSFACGTRETLQLGLREAGIAIDDVYVSYALKCRPIRAYDKRAARAACHPYLQSQLRDKEPEVLVGFGNIVAEILMGEGAEVKKLRGSIHRVEGIPTVFAYHPLAVRRRPNLMRMFVEDLRLASEQSKKGNHTGRINLQ